MVSSRVQVVCFLAHKLLKKGDASGLRRLRAVTQQSDAAYPLVNLVHNSIDRHHHMNN